MHIVMILMLLSSTVELFAQGHVFSEIRVNRQNTYVGQPVEVSVGIYTSTWFTKGIDFGNIKVNGAFTVFFRSVPASKTVNGKNYSGVTAIYNVFPYDDKNLVFPSLEFTVETPKEGDYKGVTVKVKTREKIIGVKSVPSGIDPDSWLVASGLSLNETWNGDQLKVKVGDVLERRVSRKAYGTVSELIPPLMWDSIPGVSNYPLRSEVSNEKTKTSIYSVRKEGVRYLFEKEGPVTIPEIEVAWWNPSQNKLFKRTLPSKSFEVLPNPDLGMLESVRDSLSVESVDTDLDQTEDSDNTIMGLTWRQIGLLTILSILLIRIIIRIYKYVFVTKKLAWHIRQKIEAYRHSEAYFFRRFESSLRRADREEITLKLYQWIDRLQLKEPTVDYFSKAYGNEALKAFAKQATIDLSAKDFVNQRPNFVKARKAYLKSFDSKPVKESHDWINP